MSDLEEYAELVYQADRLADENRELRKALSQARRDEREQIATHFEEHDYGIMDGDVVANIIRKEFEDES